MNTELLQVSDTVQQALGAGQAVVALESTIISHGMPYPANVETALQVEQAVIDAGAQPATIAILNGKMRVGLHQSEIETLGKAGERVRKVSRRDIAITLANNNALGATTVAATMIIAERAGIQVFATGGIGGVHRGAAESFDISADLPELAQTSVAVVCAGAKSILDLNLTREYLETQGVPVIGLGTDCWPAFYTRHSDYAVDYRLDNPLDIAQALRIKWQCGLNGGALIFVPVPDVHAIAPAVINLAIDEALNEANQRGIQGKEVTPFLLSRIAQTTEGVSLEANIALIINNAKTAARIARELAVLNSE